jgi:hypothetical protein
MRYAYGAVHDRPPRAIWAEIETILRDDGALRDGGLDGYAVMRALESHRSRGGVDPSGLPASPALRMRGSFGGLLLQVQHAHFLERSDSEYSVDQSVNGVPQPHIQTSSSSRLEDHSDHVLAGLTAETHRPLNVHLQLDASARVLAPLRKQETELFAGAQARLVWLVADRWAGGPNVSIDWLDWDRRTGPTAGDRTTWFYGGSIEYYIEDRVTLFVSATEVQRKVRGGAGGGGLGTDGSYVRDGRVSVGFSYRLSGRFAAPGFFEAARRMSGSS